MATFPDISPDFGASKSSAPAVRVTKFGDGYEQRVTFGINQILQSGLLFGIMVGKSRRLHGKGRGK